MKPRSVSSSFGIENPVEKKIANELVHWLYFMLAARTVTKSVGGTACPPTWRLLMGSGVSRDVNANTLLSLYHSFVYPCLTYCIHVWGSAYEPYLQMLQIPTMIRHRFIIFRSKVLKFNYLYFFLYTIYRCRIGPLTSTLKFHIGACVWTNLSWFSSYILVFTNFRKKYVVCVMYGPKSPSFESWISLQLMIPPCKNYAGA